MNRSFSSQEDAASYLDLQSAIRQNEEREKLLERMAEQQVELQQLQQKQKTLLSAQQQVSQIDFVTTQDLQEKLERLQTVKHRIGALQSLLDAAETSEQAETTIERKHFDGAGDVVDSKDDYANASTVVNEQLEDLYSTVTNLLSDIDKMNVLNDEQKSVALERFQPALNESSYSSDNPVCSGDKHLSPLPQVKLIENSKVKKLQQSKAFSNESPDNSIVERHYYSLQKPEARTPASSESSFNEATAMYRPVSELWDEMRKYQIQLVQLQERRKELSSYIKAVEEMKDNETFESEKHESLQPPEQVQTSFKEPNQKGASYPLSVYFQNAGKPVIGNIDASTERTNATWGGSTSTSGDESVGSIDQQDYTLSTDLNQTNQSQVPEFVETMIVKLWDELDLQNNFLQLLLDDQKALSVLLENTLSMQKNHHNTVMYGISPDFLIYQLDNCSAQIMVYRKNIVILHKELQEIQKQYPEINIAYYSHRSLQKRYLTEEQLASSFNNSSQFSTRKIPQSKRSTPLKYYTTNNGKQESLDQANDSFSRMYQAYQRTSPVASVAKYNSKSTQSDFIYKESKAEQDLYVSFTNAPSIQQLPTAPSSKSSSKHVQAVPSTQTKKQVEAVKPEISDIDSNASGYPLFEALRDTIYSEAATLISQNEARPHFLIELFHELQQLNSDYLRQHCLFVIRDVVNGYIIDTPKGVDEAGKSKAKSSNSKSKATYTDLIHSMRPLYSENTPSESEASSVSETLQFTRPSKSAALPYDYALDVSNGSNMTTPGSSLEMNDSGDNNVQNPFEVDFLGSTVIHLDEALQRVREIERIKQEELEQSGDSAGLKKQVEKESTCENVAQLDAQKLDGKIKKIVNQLIPIIKSKNEVCSEEKVEEITSMVSTLVANEHLPSKTTDNSKSDKELGEVLNQCLNKFLGYHLRECGEEMILDVSEVLFNELAYIYMIDGYQAENQNKLICDDASPRDQESQSLTSDVNDETTSSVSTSVKDDDENEDTLQDEKERSLKDKSFAGEKDSVIVDLSVSETKPLTSYGSGEDEEAGSGEEYDQYNEADDVTTSMQNDQTVSTGDKATSPTKSDSEKENIVE